MAKYIKGNAVANATSYELFEKASGIYTSLATGTEINFEVSALGLTTGDHVLVVKAKADGYEDSEYSNEVTYTVSGSSGDSTTKYTFTINPTPSSATVTLNGSVQNSITVNAGTSVTWTVEADGYTSKNGTYTVNSNYTMSVVLNASSGGDTVDLTSQFTWTPGTCTYATGAVGSGDTNWLYSNMVDVSAYSQLRFMQCQTTNTNTSLGYSFYSNTSVSSGMNGANNGGSSYTPVEKTIDVPSGATYFRCMWMNTTNTNYTEANDISNFYCYGIA